MPQYINWGSVEKSLVVISQSNLIPDLYYFNSAIKSLEQRRKVTNQNWILFDEYRADCTTNNSKPDGYRCADYAIKKQPITDYCNTDTCDLISKKRFIPYTV